MTKARDIATGGIDNSITASKLDVSGNGTAGQLLKSDGDGSFTWVDSPEPFQATTVSGTTHTLDLSSANYFNGGTTTGDTTLAFSNVPTAKTWSYDITIGGTVTVDSIINYQNNRKTFDPTSQSSASDGVFVKPDDGTKMYVCGAGSTNSKVYQYSLSTAYDISTATYDSVFYDFSGTVSNVISFGISDNGSYFYVMSGATSGLIYQFTLSTPWDISTASFTRSASPSSASNGRRSFTWSPDGTTMLLLDIDTSTNVGRFRTYTPSTAWDVSTLGSPTSSIALTSFSLPNYVNGDFTAGICFNNDGTEVYMTHYTGGTPDYYIKRFTLSTAYDFNTASYTDQLLQSQNVGDPFYGFSVLYSIQIVDNYFYCTDKSATNYILQFDTSFTTPHTFTYPASVQNPTDIISTMEYQDKYKLEFITTDGGTNVWKTGHNKYQDN